VTPPDSGKSIDSAGMLPASSHKSGTHADAWVGPRLSALLHRRSGNTGTAHSAAGGADRGAGSDSDDMLGQLSDEPTAGSDDDDLTDGEAGHKASTASEVQAASDACSELDDSALGAAMYRDAISASHSKHRHESTAGQVDSGNGPHLMQVMSIPSAEPLPGKWLELVVRKFTVSACWKS